MGCLATRRAEMSAVRRSDRVVSSAAAMAATPGGRITTICAHPYEVQAAFKLCQHLEATPDTLQVGPRAWVACHRQAPGGS